jgi:iron complex transport system ATP-binding protein
MRLGMSLGLRIALNMSKEHEVSAVMTVHDFNKALRYADKYLFLKDGVIFDAGEVSEVTAETVQAVYGLPLEIDYYRGNPVILPLEGDRNGG